ncbi:hypothetical protein [Cryptosporangium arvum]|nr:hypothetical protein [Cryptosporangium arvum]
MGVELCASVAYRGTSGEEDQAAWDDVLGVNLTGGGLRRGP